MSRKKIVLEIAGKYSNQTYMATAKKVQIHFGVSFNYFHDSHVYFFVHLPLLSEKKLRFEILFCLFEIKLTEFFGSCLFYLLCAIV